MRRDWNTVRDILLVLGEGKATYPFLPDELFAKHGANELNRHVYIMWQEGYLLVDEVAMEKNLNQYAHFTEKPVSKNVFDLTWRGHELLALIRDDIIWYGIIESLGKFECSIPVLEELAKRAIIQKVDQSEHH